MRPPGAGAESSSASAAAARDKSKGPALPARQRGGPSTTPIPGSTRSRSDLASHRDLASRRTRLLTAEAEVDTDGDWDEEEELDALSSCLDPEGERHYSRDVESRISRHFAAEIGDGYYDDNGPDYDLEVDNGPDDCLDLEADPTPYPFTRDLASRASRRFAREPESRVSRNSPAREQAGMSRNSPAREPAGKYPETSQRETPARMPRHFTADIEDDEGLDFHLEVDSGPDDNLEVDNGPDDNLEVDNGPDDNLEVDPTPYKYTAPDILPFTRRYLNPDPASSHSRLTPEPLPSQRTHPPGPSRPTQPMNPIAPTADTDTNPTRSHPTTITPSEPIEIDHSPSHTSDPKPLTTSDATTTTTTAPPEPTTTIATTFHPSSPLAADPAYDLHDPTLPPEDEGFNEPTLAEVTEQYEREILNCLSSHGYARRRAGSRRPMGEWADVMAAAAGGSVAGPAGAGMGTSAKPRVRKRISKRKGVGR